MAKTVDDYIAQADRWRDEIARLRAILLDVGLDETVKWGGPCYTLDGRNVVGIGAFKSCFGLWFFQGALLADPAKRLVNAQPGKTRAMRQWRMQSAADIRPRLVRQYASEAAELAARGREIRPRRRPAASLPPELEAALGADNAVRTAFDKLTPGRRREFAEFIAGAKRAETRERRVARALPLIREGRGLNDPYRS